MYKCKRGKSEEYVKAGFVKTGLLLYIQIIILLTIAVYLIMIIFLRLVRKIPK